MRTLIPALALCHLTSTVLPAQRLSDRAALANIGRGETAVRVEPIRQSDRDDWETGNMMRGGFAGALVFGVAGAVVGYKLVDSCDYFCGVTEALVGALIGEAVGIPIGVRMAGGRGSLPAQILVSAAVFAVGAWAAPVTHGLSLLPIVPLQLHLVIKDAKSDTTRTEAPR